MRSSVTSRLYFSKMPSSLARNGARFDGVTLPYDDLILIGEGFGVCVAAAADAPGVPVAAGAVPPHAVTTRVSIIKGTSKTRADRIEYLPQSRLVEPRMVIPFARP